MANETKIRPWQYEETTRDMQLDEVKQQQAVAGASKGAQDALGAALAKDVRDNADYKTEAEQFGKEPWERWYSHPLVGRGGQKGIADFIFLSVFGHSSATDTKRTRAQRAVIRVVLTVVVFYILSLIRDYLTRVPTN